MAVDCYRITTLPARKFDKKAPAEPIPRAKAAFLKGLSTATTTVPLRPQKFTVTGASDFLLLHLRK